MGLNPNSDGSEVFSYQYLAADVNKDGRVNAADALTGMILQARLLHQRRSSLASLSFLLLLCTKSFTIQLILIEQASSIYIAFIH